jgi:hypothetical protein
MVLHVVGVLVSVLFGKIILLERRQWLIFLQMQGHLTFIAHTLWFEGFGTTSVNEGVLLFILGPIQHARWIIQCQITFFIGLEIFDTFFDGFAFDYLGPAYCLRVRGTVEFTFRVLKFGFVGIFVFDGYHRRVIVIFLCLRTRAISHCEWEGQLQCQSGTKRGGRQEEGMVEMTRSH